MTLTLYGLKNCDTCKKVLKALKQNGHIPDFHDVRADRVTKTSLTKWVKAVGWEKLLNTRSTTWRGLKDTEKEGVDEKKAIALMVKHPTLIKRPVIETNDAIHVGWSKETAATIIN